MLISSYPPSRGLPAGVYLARVRAAGATASAKFVVLP
jgi:hypothetical protein